MPLAIFSLAMFQRQRWYAVREGRSQPAWTESGLLEAIRLAAMSGLGRWLMIIILHEKSRGPPGPDF